MPAGVGVDFNEIFQTSHAESRRVLEWTRLKSRDLSKVAAGRYVETDGVEGLITELPKEVTIDDMQNEGLFTGFRYS